MKHKPISAIRTTYKKSSLTEDTVADSPYDQFTNWFKSNLKSNPYEPNAMNLATVDIHSKPSTRIVLLKGFDPASGFTFFTNYQSRKGQDLNTNPHASLLFYWPEQERQIRIEGKVKKLSRRLSEEYFHTRPRGSQLRAWTSDQSKSIPDRAYLDQINRQLEQYFKPSKIIPVPPFWGGYSLVPDYFEFWQGREDRLHDRISYRLVRKKWVIGRLAP